MEPTIDSTADTSTLAPRRRFGRVPRAGLVIGGVCVVALAASGVAFASTSFSSSSSSSSGSSKPAPSTHGYAGRYGGQHFAGGSANGPMGFGGGFGGFGGGNVVHEVVTEKNDSSYQTIAYQVGAVTAVSSTSITVKSADNYSATYVVTSKSIVDSQSNGIKSVATGNQVSLEATVSGRTDTAANIVDTTKVGVSRKSFGFGNTQTWSHTSRGAQSGTSKS